MQSQLLSHFPCGLDEYWPFSISGAAIFWRKLHQVKPILYRRNNMKTARRLGGSWKDHIIAERKSPFTSDLDEYWSRTVVCNIVFWGIGALQRTAERGGKESKWPVGTGLTRFYGCNNVWDGPGKEVWGSVCRSVECATWGILSGLEYIWIRFLPSLCIHFSSYSLSNRLYSL